MFVVRRDDSLDLPPLKEDSWQDFDALGESGMAAREPAVPTSGHESVKDVLADIEARAKGSGRRLTRDMIAEDAGVARGAVSGWFTGKQVPRRPQLDALATIFSFGDDRLRMENRRRLFEAADVPMDLSGPREPLARARQRAGEIIVGLVTYDKDGVDRFFKEVVSAFGDFCAVPATRREETFEQLAISIEAGDAHIGGGLWQTPERLLTLRFIATPIAVAANMLTFADARRAIRRRSDGWDVGVVAPIMNEGQAVYRFAQHVLKIPVHRITPCPYREDIFVDRLCEAYARWRQHPDPQAPVPVIVSDELMCVKIHNKLASRMIADQIPLIDRAEAGPPEMLLGREDMTWTLNGKPIAAHPRYNISLCVKRVPNDEWYSYLEDAWRIFLRGNLDFIVEKYRRLADRLTHRVADAQMIREQLESSIVWKCEEDRLDSELGRRRWRALLESWLFVNVATDFNYHQTWGEIIKQTRDKWLVDNPDPDTRGMTMTNEALAT